MEIANTLTGVLILLAQLKTRRNATGLRLDLLTLIGEMMIKTAGKKVELTQERLKEFLHYDPETGLFKWMARTARNVKVGDAAGCLDRHGYIRISIKGRHYRSHRLAYLYMTGRFPKQIDHINHDRADNRWINLREVNQAENNKNRPMQGNNKSGFIGVSFHKRQGRWQALIRVDGKLTHLGYHNKLSDAVLARVEAESLYGFHLNHGKVITPHP